MSKLIYRVQIATAWTARLMAIACLAGAAWGAYWHIFTALLYTLLSVQLFENAKKEKHSA